ncbi:M20/M25/M40 family metallo-hydrolase [Citricoccus sp.]|uniref:M20/M25/M40 family metallo-hydrolase n=1 Tax=Citricoccus sp. TaxID=1978372 RepID=UPI00260EF1BF|nr:M20/M25/M40 family metallo-hydrolase [Citricoccus sp.]HRO93999.1 M20/M25/M40 family metallo-hydrolase [Citricoccus sp.]
MTLNGPWKALGDLKALGRLTLAAGAAAAVAWQSHIPTAYEHLEQFQVLADEHGDRAAGSPGYEAAAQYVERELARAGYETTRQYFTVETWDQEYESFSIIAETTGGDEDNVIMLGAHLDGVPGSPAINDNASGTAALLETAQRLAQQDSVTNKVRFAWWGAEEIRGYPGSTHYVEELTEDGELGSIAAYLNVDMVASPNHVVGVYDAREPDEEWEYGSGPPVPDGSEQVMEVFTDYFSAQGQPWVPTSWNFASDQVAFVEAGVPVGGLFTGSKETKTEAEATDFGGRAEAPRDPNYHQPGDDLDNIDREALALMTEAITHAATTLAQDTGALE